jgi:3-oxoadipate enol-lactonase
MPKVKINDISMYYEIHGQGEPLVLIAGFSVDHLAWTLALEHFAKNYQVILLDNRGAGQSDSPQGAYSIEQMAQDIADLCSHLRIKRAHFVGNSMGGFLVQMLAYHHPELVKSGTISNSSMHMNICFNIYASAYLELLKANAPMPALIKSSAAWVFSFDYLSQPEQLDALIQLRLNNPYPFTVSGYEGQYSALKGFDSQNWAKNITAPLFIITSDQDLIFNESLSKDLHHQIPRAHYYCFENCGHVPYIEYPKKFAEKVMDFIDSI